MSSAARTAARCCASSRRRTPRPKSCEIDEINAGVYAFDAAWLRRRIGDVKPSPVSGEFYLPELVTLAREDRRPVVSLEVEDDGTLAGINDRSQLAAAELELRHGHQRAPHARRRDHGRSGPDLRRRHRRAGARTSSSSRTSSCAAAPGSARAPGSAPAARSSTRSSAATASSGPACSNAPKWRTKSRSGRSRTCGPKSSIGRKARLGNFAEVKASRLEAGVQQHHFSYIGDAELGERTNVGAGTITCNYDGARKHKTKIGKGVFLGSDTMLVAPVELGDGPEPAPGPS